MKQFVTKGIILRRTDFGEADRILTLLTPDHGKVQLLAKGVRRVKSKLAGGIELFSVSTIIYSPGRGSLGTLISTRLIKHYGHIVENIERTMLGYEFIRQVNNITEDEVEEDYFMLLEYLFDALNDRNLDLDIIKLWFSMQLLKLNGYMPNLQTDKLGHKLIATTTYGFSPDDSMFYPAEQGLFGASHIKFLRLGFGSNTPRILNQIQGSSVLAETCAPIVTAMLHTFLRV